LWSKLVTTFEDISRDHSTDGVITEAKFASALGYQFLIGGCALGFVSGVMGLLDRYVCASEEQVKRAQDAGAFSCDGDGVGYSGRLGSLLTICSWILLLAALGTGDWVKTEKLGAAGCFCSNAHWTNRSSGCAGGASFGLWEYCVYPFIDQYNHDAYPVCWKYTDVVSTPGATSEFALENNCTAMTGTGLERFAEWSVQEKRFITGWGVIGAIALVMIADVYSEKLMLCCGLNFAATGVGIFCVIIWISFFEDLSKGTDARMTFGFSGWLLVMAFGSTSVTAILYGKDWLCNIKHFIEVKDSSGKLLAKKDFDGNNVKEVYRKSGSGSDESGSEDDSGSDDSDDSDDSSGSSKKKRKGKKKKRGSSSA